MKSSLIKKGDDRNEIFIPLPSHFTENLISPDSNQKLACLSNINNSMPNTGVTMNSPRQGCLSLHLESWEIPKFNANFGKKIFTF